MYTPFKEESTGEIKIRIKIPWNKNTAIGFAFALLIITIIFLITSLIKIYRPNIVVRDLRYIPIEEIRFGEGPGSGTDGGNLMEKGSAHKGTQVSSIFQSAEIASQNKSFVNINVEDPEILSKNIVAVKVSSNVKKEEVKEIGTSNKNIGLNTGTTEGTGLSNSGTGEGLGKGLGIEWGGGGGNRTADGKLPPLPKIPSDYTNIKQLQIKILFRVDRNGFVYFTKPLKKGDPRLDEMAMQWVRKIKFSPSDKEAMEGIIPVTFIQN